MTAWLELVIKIKSTFTLKLCKQINFFVKFTLFLQFLRIIGKFVFKKNSHVHIYFVWFSRNVFWEIIALISTFLYIKSRLVGLETLKLFLCTKLFITYYVYTQLYYYGCQYLCCRCWRVAHIRGWWREESSKSNQAAWN